VHSTRLQSWRRIQLRRQQPSVCFCPPHSKNVKNQRWKNIVKAEKNNIFLLEIDFTKFSTKTPWSYATVATATCHLWKNSKHNATIIKRNEAIQPEWRKSPGGKMLTWWKMSEENIAHRAAVIFCTDQKRGSTNSRAHCGIFQQQIWWTHAQHQN